MLSSLLAKADGKVKGCALLGITGWCKAREGFSQGLTRKLPGILHSGPFPPPTT